MAQRLPVPGQDDGTWGLILNGFLEVAHDSSGNLLPTAVNSAATGILAPLSNGTVPTSNLAIGTASSSNFLRGDGIWAVPATGSSSLAGNSDVTITSPTNNQALKYNSATAKWVNAQLAETDIAGLTTDLAAKADTASLAQVARSGSYIDLSDKPSLITLDATAADIQPLGTQAAGATGKAADAGHVHVMPRLDQVSVPTASVSLNGQKITGLANGTAVTDAVTYGQLPISGTGITNTNGTWSIAYGSAATTAAAGNDSRFAGSAAGTVAAALAATDPTTTNSRTPNGTASGDLSGVFPSPAVTKINGISLPSSAPAAGTVLTATSSSATTWTTPAAGISLDTTDSDIVAGTVNGSGSAGTTGKAADAGHKHPLQTHDHTTVNEGGQIPVAGLNASGTATAITYLRGDGSWATPSTTDATKLAIANNLSELTASAGIARTNLGLATVAATGSYNDLINKPTISPSLTIGSSTTTSGVLLVNQLTPVDATAGTIAMTLPPGQGVGSVIGVRKQDTTNNAVTITGNISGVVNTTHTLQLSAETVVYEADGTGSWWIIGGNKTLSSLDGRYPLKTNNLSDLTNATTARTNLGVDASGTQEPSLTVAAWAANTPYLKGQLVLSPVSAYIAGATSLIQATAIFTSSATFTASNWTRLSDIGTVAAGGDLAGTLPNPTVAKINGIAVSGTPLTGQALIASSATAATWANLPVLVPYSMPGSLVVKTGAIRQYVETPYTITNVRASVGTAPTGSSIIIDILVNGTTIYTTQANRPTIAVNTNTVTANSPNTSTLNAGDYITVNVSQVGSTIAGADLSVSLTLMFV